MIAGGYIFKSPQVKDAVVPGTLRATRLPIAVMTEKCASLFARCAAFLCRLNRYNYH